MSQSPPTETGFVRGLNLFDATMIVIGNQGMHGAKRVLGSVPNSVSHKARCNVLIVSTDPD